MASAHTLLQTERVFPLPAGNAIENHRHGILKRQSHERDEINKDEINRAIGERILVDKTS